MFRASPISSLLSLLALLVPTGTATAQTDPAAEPSHKGAVVVELFTSEGCSSCPPADRLLAQINGKVSSSGQQIVALSEHVTYWNRLGWKDPFSEETMTERQNEYATRLRLDEVYTPQMVINGREQIVGGDGPALEAALQSEGRRPPVAVQVLSSTRAGDSLRVAVRLGAHPAPETLELWAAVTDDLDESRVLRGENGGRLLKHVAVVRSVQRLATARGAGDYSGSISLPADVLSNQHAGHHLAVFAQAPAFGPIYGSDVQPLAR